MERSRSGPDRRGQAIAYKDGKVYVGGTFTGPGGVEDRNNLAVWDGVSWGTVCNDTSPGPAFGGNVDDLQIIGSTLWVGGEFQNGAHIATADYLVACDLNTGAATSPFTVDGHGSGPMYALTADSGGNLYGAGTFINLAGIPQADYVAKWNGAAWSAMGSGPGPGLGAVTGITRSLTANGTDVFIGTDAKDVAGIPLADHVAKWDGAAWSALGSDTAGTNGWFTTLTSVYALTTSGSQLFAAGSFQNANGDSRADNVASFDGSAWHPVGSDGAGNGPLNGEGRALATFGLGAPLHAGGNFTNAGGDTQADFVARYGSATVAVPTPTVTAAPGPVPTPTVTPAPAADTTAPAVSAYKLSASVFRALSSGASIAAVKRGTTVRYRLSEIARVPFVVQAKSSGRKVGRRCAKPTRANRRRKACVRYVKAGGFTHAGVAGENRFRFSGRVKRRALKPGKYRLVAVAVDAAGNRSARLSRPFRIIR